MTRKRICTPDVRPHLGLHQQPICTVCVVLILFSCIRSGECRIFFVSQGESIQARVDSTTFGDTVIVEDGEYEETVLIIGKSMTLSSRYLLDNDTCHIAATILRPFQVRPDTGSCVLIAEQPFDSAQTRIVGLTCANGTGTLVDTDSGLNEVIGGGIAAINCNTVIEHCLVIECQASRGAGIAVNGEGSEVWKESQICSTVIRDCHAEALGGGANFAYSNLTVLGSQFLRNECPGGGSAFYSYACSLRVVLCEIDSNYGSSAVGIVHRLVEFDRCHFSRSSTSMWGTTEIEASFCRGRIHHCLFEDNITTSICFRFSRIGQAATPFFESNVVQNCRGLSLSDIMLLSSSTTRIERNLFLNNVTGLGSVIQIMGNNAGNTIRHNVFIGNTAIQPTYGTVLYDQTPTRATIDSNWISNNQAVVITGHESPFPFNCLNNWWGHESGPFHAELNPTGQGDTLVGNDCDFIPWLTSPPDTTGWLPAIERPRIPISKTWELVNVFPNPFNSSVMIAFSGITGADFEISIHNLLGQKVDTITHGALTGTTLHYTAPRELSSGVYFLVARDRVHNETKKVVLLR